MINVKLRICPNPVIHTSFFFSSSSIHFHARTQSQRRRICHPLAARTPPAADDDSPSESCRQIAVFCSVLCFCTHSFSPLFLAFYGRVVPCRLVAVVFLHRVCRRRHLPSAAVVATENSGKQIQADVRTKNRNPRQMSAGGAFGGNRGLRPVPPEKGVFPLDHMHQCDLEKKEYLSCLKSSGHNSENCRIFSKKYLECRMEKNLMAKQDLSELGFRKENNLDPAREEKNERIEN